MVATGPGVPPLVCGPPLTMTPVKLVNATADFEQSEHPIVAPYRRGDKDNRALGPAAFLADGHEHTAWGADRGPGRAWEMGPAIDAAAPEAATKPTRVGYARCSTAQ